MAVMTALPDGSVEWMQSVPDPGDSDPAGTATMRLLPDDAAGTTATMSPLPESVAAHRQSLRSLPRRRGRSQ